ncbi:PTS sugar transporter subunit IIA [Francisella tularensis]|uniref:PTS sugar transporter subunit IIA n=1 Tax=Francisella tularensis TaxID=263 RepID=UPI000173E300|nr:PTS sugar transporter subunit IIA [Francisella tularensis]ACD30977.1 PEP-dependent sugar phosphotransferase system [Francisella tularensis subsp. mediasiatica FSC147]MBK2077324.1 PTS sugar transporter subunit IIA [Francisella tularensis subsp. mediasiatica]MBK2101897.1 PTS sugar transporter subunit IIA [Francisella tularensis subsp. mediasiatica]MBK2105125.1 PTS sugar transporter subunit IIA [Francisella tularensis subsp. mediasiatica]MDN9003408.1 PTS sugar transporter subunit IIA [Francise
MNLKALIDKKNIILNLNIESKKRLIEFFANRIADTYPDVSEDLVLKNIYKRERIGNTYIGKNIYIPHCRVENLMTTRLIIMTLKNSCYDDSVNDDIKIAVGVFFPDNISTIHMELLKQLALYLKQDKTQQYFQQAENSEDLYNLIINTSNE